MAAAFAQRGYKLAGFDAKVKSTVLPGSGLSSSAAFEVLIGRILNGLFADNAVSAIEIAQIGQYAENVYYGKPSGLIENLQKYELAMEQDDLPGLTALLDEGRRRKEEVDGH